MSKLDPQKAMFRYKFFFVLMTIVGVAILVRAGYIMTVEADYWEQVGNRLKRDSISLSPARGNILSCNGQVLATTLPEYYLIVDFDAMHTSRADTLWDEKEDSICAGLHALFPSRSTEEFRRQLRAAKASGTKYYRLWPQRVNYNDYTTVHELPIFRLPQNTGGFYGEQNNARLRPYGSIAARTIGTMYGEKDSAKCGIELSFDSLLRGKNGIMRRRKFLNRYVSLIDEPAIDGADIVTTIDVDMQDIAESALIDELKLPEVNAEMGVAILMEVATGDIKAIVNMSKQDDGKYYEMVNSAINYRCEPGSVFKTASIMVALDDGVCDTNMVISTGKGVVQMHSRQMKDHNYPRGFGDINVARAMEVSSNIGVSTVIDNYYSADPNKFVEGLYRLGINDDLALPLIGYNAPKIDYIKLNNKGLAEDKTRLPWMSIGYNTQIAPINTLTFYNAIANNGTMVKPRFVTKIVKDGVTLAAYPTEVLREHIAKPATISTIQTILRHVVSQGLGKKAGSPLFSVAGKTGTAQVAQGSRGYKSGTTGYWLTFVGYFPAEAPLYSCIVCIKKWGMPASGGGMSGVVFRHIAERVMARTQVYDINDVESIDYTPVPAVKRGDLRAAQYILTNLAVPTYADWDGSYATGNPIWGVAVTDSTETIVLKHEAAVSRDIVPDVRGMGAKDAVYLLESRGLRVHLDGVGIVRQQSLAPGSAVHEGEVCQLQLAV